MLTVLTNNTTNNTTKSTPDYTNIYHKAFKRSLMEGKITQAIYYGVKYVISMDEPKQMNDAMYKFEMIHIVNKCISAITPAVLMGIFPVKKEFDGEKYGTKDYFFTMQAINNMGIDTIIGENVQDLLWDYQNTNIKCFMLAEFSTASYIRQMNGQKGIVEEFCEHNKIETYTVYKDSTGCEYIQNNTTGKTAKVKREIPRYIKLVK